MNDNQHVHRRAVEFLAFALSSTVFAAVALVGLIWFGEADVRSAAVLAAIFASASQFVGSNTWGSPRLFLASLVFAYAAFATAVAALLMMIF